MKPRIQLFKWVSISLFISLVIITCHYQMVYVNHKGMHIKYLRWNNMLQDDFYIFEKSPPNTPFIPVDLKQDMINSELRAVNNYGRKGDAAHLGGFTSLDLDGISTNLWNFMLGPIAIKSIVDIGCGLGHSTKYFMDRKARVLCIEGSHDAVKNSLLPPEVIVEHDFTLGAWWPDDTFDACWAVEFLEHIGRQYIRNYLPVFKKCAIIITTSSPWGGWHHVEIHNLWWWRARFATAGFIYSEELTSLFKQQAENGKNTTLYPEGDAYHLRSSLSVYINPLVAFLQSHKHIFGGNGCFDDSKEPQAYFNEDGGVPCKSSDQLPSSFESLLDCSRQGVLSPVKYFQMSVLNFTESVWNCTQNSRVSSVMNKKSKAD